MNVGRVGIWSIGLRNDDPNAAGEIREAAAELEQLGYDAIWLGESPGVHHAEPVLEATSRVVVATGMLNIWEYDAADVAAPRLLHEAAQLHEQPAATGLHRGRLRRGRQ